VSFIWPSMLFSLAAVPLLALWYLVLQRRQRKIAAQYSSLGLTQGVPGRNPRLRRHMPPTLFLLSLAILLVALARPQMVVSLPRVEGTVILAFDVSGSMAADDMKPTRMEAAKAAALDFVDRQPLSVQVGVVAFSDNGFSVQAPTDDHEAIAAAINRLTPTRGTSLANGILVSLNTIAAMDAPEPPRYYSNVTPAPTPWPTPVPRGTHSSAVIVLLTDGENNESPDPLVAAQLAADRGVRVYTVGIGSPAGANIQIEGFTIHTTLDEAMLKQIAQISDGAYFNAQNQQELLSIYENLEPQLALKPEKTEITAILAGAGILVMLVAGMLSLVWFSRVP
jgi:Ca-activated chloride channel family protein